jgi:hypothetical protein
VIDVKLERKKTGLFSGILPKKPDERIKRGYKQIHDFDDGVPDLNPHLILVVHGIKFSIV